MKPIFYILFALLCSGVAKAQTCTGSVGDPIVNITFGAGSTVGSPLPPGTTTNLSFWPDDCPNDGQYTIINKTGPCFINTWHSITDHTGDSSGYFMLINASYEPSTFYVQTIDGLCAGTRYRFGAWIMNMCNFTSAISPNITFTIEKTDGTVLSSKSTGNIPINTTTAVWNQYSLDFTTPEGISTVVLRMRNNAPGGIGNDLSLDDITFRPIGPAIAVSSPNISGDTTLICSADPNTLKLESKIEQCYPNTEYQWQVSTDNGVTWTDVAGATGTVYDRPPTEPGRYLYRLAAAQRGNINVTTCRVISEPFAVFVYAPDSRTVAITAPEGAVCENSPVTFRAKTTFAGSTPSFQWMINDQKVGAATGDSSFTTAQLVSGDRVNCVFASSLSCNSPLTSNSIAMNIIKKARTTINRFICEGDSYEGYNVSGTYTDNFPGSNGCDSVRTLVLVVYPKQHTVFDTSVCYGTSYMGLSKEGAYDYIYPDVHGCDSVYTISLHVLPDINAKPVLDTILCAGDFIILSPGTFDTYRWQDGSTNSTFTVDHGGTYNVTATNKCGTASKTVRVNEKVCTITFPSAFTPNGDGRNDIFKLVNAYNISKYHCTIYNRWGQKVFESLDYRKGWNGLVNSKKAEPGTYIWFCEYTKAGEDVPVQIRGTVVLIP